LVFSGPKNDKGRASILEEPLEILPVVDNDARTPIERFRSQRHKALSVMDLVSPSWCELQYLYTLKYHGRKKRTPAMKAGSSIHQKLQDEVFTTVKVEVQSVEDGWGLRIWNTIQGLQSLKETGHTRELEVWGVVHGQVVNGVIDDLSFASTVNTAQKIIKTPDIPSSQTTLPTYFDVPESSQTSAADRAEGYATRKLYICDVKTRATTRLPNKIAFRPTQYQLMIYHHLLSALAGNKTDLDVIASRHNLDIHAPLSDSILAGLGSLRSTPSTLASPAYKGDDSSASTDSMDILLSLNSIASLWALMIQELQTLLPLGPASIGDVLKTEYRHRTNGEIIGVKTFVMDEEKLQTYLSRNMEWWQGRRQALGVSVEEAFKCHSCDFAEKCQWRLSKVAEAEGKARSKSMRNKG
jgi:exonuclease V